MFPQRQEFLPSDGIQLWPKPKFQRLISANSLNLQGLADARSSFGDTGGGGDGAPQRLISAWSSLRSTMSSRPQRAFNAVGHLIANEGSDEGKRLHRKL